MASSRLLGKRVSEVYIVIDLSCSFVKNVLEGSGNNGKKTKKNLRELFLSNRKDLSVIDNLKTKFVLKIQFDLLKAAKDTISALSIMHQFLGPIGGEDQI